MPTAAEVAIEEAGIEEDRVAHLLASVEDEADRQIVERLLDGWPQAAIATEMGVSQQAVGKRMKKYFGGRL